MYWALGIGAEQNKLVARMLNSNGTQTSAPLESLTTSGVPVNPKEQKNQVQLQNFERGEKLTLKNISRPITQKFPRRSSQIIKSMNFRFGTQQSRFQHQFSCVRCFYHQNTQCRGCSNPMPLRILATSKVLNWKFKQTGRNLVTDV